MSTANSQRVATDGDGWVLVLNPRCAMAPAEAMAHAAWLATAADPEGTAFGAVLEEVRRVRSEGIGGD
jgi:hypothetical protein